MILKQCVFFFKFTMLCELVTQRLLQEKWLKWRWKIPEFIPNDMLEDAGMD